MSLSSSNYAADAYVTAANPAPGRPETVSYPVRSGTQWTEAFTTRSDGGIGLNVYVAGGSGPAGVIPVSQTNPTPISLSGVTIGAIVTVTSSQADPVWVTGSVYVINPSSGSVGISGTITATITGVVEVSQSNIQLTQSVYILAQPIGVTGTVGVSGTASVRVESFGGPVEVFGGVSVSGSVTASITGTVAVSQTNIPLTQSVFVVNQQSSSITGTVTVTSSQTDPVWVTSSLPVSGGLVQVNIVSGSISASVSIPVPVSAGLGLVPYSSASTVLLSSSASRITFSIYNDADQYYLVRLGAAADQLNFTFAIPPFFLYESPFPSWQGAVHGVGWTGGGYPGSGTIHITEQSP